VLSPLAATAKLVGGYQTAANRILTAQAFCLFGTFWTISHDQGHRELFEITA
jgi:hypothetical protein